MQAILKSVSLLLIFPFLLSCGEGNSTNTSTENQPVASQTFQCQSINSESLNPDQNHWYSPSSSNIDDQAINQCNSCLDPLNINNKSCYVDSFLRSNICTGTSCGDTQGLFTIYNSNGYRLALQHDLRFQNPDLYPRALGEGCRFILWALDPVIGVEDKNRRSNINYWREAYLASQSSMQPSYPRETLGLLIQSALTRGQHQLHIHMGTLTQEYQQALLALNTNPDITQYVSINGYDFLVRYVPHSSVDDPYLNIDLFEKASQMLPNGEADMPRYGLMTALSGDLRGIYLMAALGLDRAELNYRQQYQCSFR